MGQSGTAKGEPKPLHSTVNISCAIHSCHGDVITTYIANTICVLVIILQFILSIYICSRAKMRVSTMHLQQLTIFTTVLTGGGIGTMYYLQQKTFCESDYHRLALQKLEACPAAMESLGAPPLKVHNIHLTDRDNRVDHHTAQLKIPVTGSKTGGYLYTSSIRDPNTNRWSLKQAVLKLREGQILNLLTASPPTQTHETEQTEVLDTGWHWPNHLKVTSIIFALLDHVMIMANGRSFDIELFLNVRMFCVINLFLMPEELPLHHTLLGHSNHPSE